MKFVRKHWLRILISVSITIMFIASDVFIPAKPLFQFFDSLFTVIYVSIVTWEICDLYHKDNEENK